MKINILIFSLFIAMVQSYGQTSTIIMSSIGPQEVYEGARTTVYFSTLKYFETIEFSSDNMPDFGTIINDGKGDGRVIFDPTQEDIGEYTIHLNASNGDLFNHSIIHLSVKAIPDDANIYYLDPVSGDANNPGTADQPLPSLEDVLNNNLININSKTFLFLRTGHHGSALFQGTYGSPVHVLAERNHTPLVRNIVFFFATNWYISNLHVSSENSSVADGFTLVRINAGCDKLTLTNCKIYNIEDASVWTTNQDWYDGCARGWGIYSLGRECLFQNNYLKNTWFSLEMRREDNEFSYNIINWFGADAIRALGDNQQVLYNQIKNATVFDYDHPLVPQHDDGIQSYVTPLTSSVPVKGIHIIGNQIADITDPNLPLPTEIMQGIVDFDGFEEDWVVENNLIITHHQHGIALYGAKNCKVTNNTVVRNPFNLYFTSSYPWIRINPRKQNVGGELSTGNLVRNNITDSYRTDGHEPATADYNIIDNDYAALFVDYTGWNFQLSANSSALNAGVLEDAPFTDLFQKRRIIGNIDAGCFEQDANLLDIEQPTAPSNITASQTTETSITLSWTTSEDDNGVAYYQLSIDGNKEQQTVSPSALITGLKAGTEYEVNISAVDYFGNVSAPAVHVESTNQLSLLTTYFIPADKHDQLIKSNAQLMWVGMPFHRIGGYFGNFDASVVLPFKLPCLDDERQIVAADLTMTLESIVNSPNGSIDLYGLLAASSNSVSASHHWQGPFGQDPAGFSIAAAYINPQTPNGQATLNEGQKVVLGGYLQGLYDTGTDCNDYAFLRLNTSLENEVNNAYYQLISADNNNSFETPLLSIITSATTGVEAIEVKNGLRISPNPVSSSAINIQIQGFETERAVLVIHNAKGQEVFRSNIDTLDSNLQINTDLSAGVYFTSLLGERKYARAKLIIL